jgi:hypothetical protein
MIQYTLYTKLSIQKLVELFEPFIIKSIPSVLSQEQVIDMINKPHNKSSIHDSYSFLYHIRNVIRTNTSLSSGESILFCKFVNQLGLIHHLYSKRLQEIPLKINKDIVKYVILPYIDNSLSLCLTPTLEVCYLSSKTFEYFYLYNQVKFVSTSLNVSDFINKIQEKEDEFYSLLSRHELNNQVEIVAKETYQ